ncbi:MAG: phytase, partial [Bacteroidota bacterium]
ADDPAIWVNRQAPENSLVFGTDKLGGLASYNLKGEELFYYPVGKMNNCDIRYDFLLNGGLVDILAASNRTSHSISLYKITADGRLDSLHKRIITSEMDDEVYGICLYKSAVTGKCFVFLNSKAGEVEQWELFEQDGGIDARLVRSFEVNTQTEGMVADDEAGILYLGHEVAGIWKFDAEPDGENEGEFVDDSSEDNPAITYDIEGLAIYDSGSREGYLVASSQGNNSFALFERQGNNSYLGSFKIIDGKTDGVEDTDGIDITGVPLGPDFPKGLLVVQDGINYDGQERKSQNFKLVSWEAIESGLLQNADN